MTPQALAALHAAAFDTGRPWTAAEFATLCASPHVMLTTAPGGFALWRCVAREAELLTIAVHPDQQRRGVATDLMARWMQDAEADTAFLEVAADNGAACALYRRSGFECVARRAAYYPRPNGAVDALVMRAAL